MGNERRRQREKEQGGKERLEKMNKKAQDQPARQKAFTGAQQKSSQELSQSLPPMRGPPRVAIESVKQVPNGEAPTGQYQRKEEDVYVSKEPPERSPRITTKVYTKPSEASPRGKKPGATNQAVRVTKIVNEKTPAKGKRPKAPSQKELVTKILDEVPVKEKSAGAAFQKEQNLDNKDSTEGKSLRDAFQKELVTKILGEKSPTKRKSSWTAFQKELTKKIHADKVLETGRSSGAASQQKPAVKVPNERVNIKSPSPIKEIRIEKEKISIAEMQKQRLKEILRGGASTRGESSKMAIQRKIMMKLIDEAFALEPNESSMSKSIDQKFSQRPIHMDTTTETSGVQSPMDPNKKLVGQIRPQLRSWAPHDIIEKVIDRARQSNRDWGGLLGTYQSRQERPGIVAILKDPPKFTSEPVGKTKEQDIIKLPKTVAAKHSHKASLLPAPNIAQVAEQSELPGSVPKVVKVAQYSKAELPQITPKSPTTAAKETFASREREWRRLMGLRQKETGPSTSKLPTQTPKEVKATEIDKDKSPELQLQRQKSSSALQQSSSTDSDLRDWGGLMDMWKHN